MIARAVAALLVAALLSATVLVSPQRISGELHARVGSSRAGVDHRAIRAQREQAPTEAARARREASKSAHGARPPPSWAQRSPARRLLLPGLAVAHPPAPRWSAPPPLTLRDQRLTIRRNRALAHAPRMGDDDTPTA